MTARRAVVIGIGNSYRRDDAVGLVVADHIGRTAGPGVLALCCDGEPTTLIQAWSDVDIAVVVDAVVGSSAPVGGLCRMVVTAQDAARRFERAPGGSGSHGLGLPEAIALARALDLLPRRLVVLGVEVADVRTGVGLSPPVAAAVADVVAAAHRELDEVVDGNLVMRS